MERITCDYCGMEFDARLTQCPLCGRTVSDTSSLPKPEELAAAEAPELRADAKQSRVKAAEPRRGAYSGKRVKKKTEAPKKSAQPEPAWTSGEENADPNPYAIPRWMMALICIILAIAVLGGALIAFTQVGWSPLYGMLDSPRTLFSRAAAKPSSQPAQTVQEQPVQQPDTPAPVPTESQYTNEEDQKPEEQAPVQQQSSECTALKLSAPTVTFEKADRFFNLTYDRQPETCTEPVVFTSSNESVATVNEQGKIVAVNRGTSVITATCGTKSDSCLVTCDFDYIPVDTPQTGEIGQLPLALNNTDMTFFSPGEQFHLAVMNAPADARITFESSDPEIATVTDTGLITARSSGTVTITVTVDGFEPLRSIVRCRLDNSAEQNPNLCTISNSDVTMGLKGENFQLTLKDPDGNRITGLLWVSQDDSVCTVDQHGVVTAVGKGTTNVTTTYDGVTYTCIVRCNF